MEGLFGATCLALILACFGVGALNPDFDKETLALQLALTDWTSDASKRELGDVIHGLFPMNVSAECSKATNEWAYALTQKDGIAIKMVDAFGKVPAGLLLGHLLILGHFDECLNLTRQNNDTGKWEPAANYCLTRLDHPLIRSSLPAMPAYGVCLPVECANGHDANAFVTGLFPAVLRAAKGLEGVRSICVKTMPKTEGFYVMATLIVLIAFVVTAAGVVDCLYRRRYKNSHNGDLNGGDATEVFDQTKVSGKGLVITSKHLEIQRKQKYGYANVPAFLKPLLCFNIMTNFRSIVSAGTEGEISFLHGFRVLSLWWIILGHTYYLGRNFFENSLMFFDDVRSAGFQIVLNAGYAVDSFFLLSGLLIAYVLFRDLAKHDGKLNWVLVYFHRWWRLTPVYMFVMLFYVYVLPYGIKSPFKLLIAQEGIPTDYCKSHWWTNILYINNFFPVLKNRQCMNWTWFLALDMQFFIITPLLVIILYRSRAFGLAIIGVIVAACVATTMGLIGYYGLPVHFWQGPVYNTNVTGYNKDVDYIYEKPYTRITPFVIGVVLGYIFVNRPVDKQAAKRPLIGFVGWLTSFALAVPLLWGFYFSGWNPADREQGMSVGARVVYGGLQRLGWSLVVGWILFACQYGYAGPVRQFLGSRFWRPLSNLTYGAYLVHMLTIQLYFASQRHMIFYSPLNMIMIFIGQIVLAYGVALLIAVLVEVPLLRLERLIVRRSL